MYACLIIFWMFRVGVYNAYNDLDNTYIPKRNEIYATFCAKVSQERKNESKDLGSKVFFLFY